MRARIVTVVLVMSATAAGVVALAQGGGNQSDPVPPAAPISEKKAAAAPPVPVNVAGTVAEDARAPIAAPSPEALAASPPPPNAAANADPVQVVEAFVERNRQEAETTIQALSKEAEDLKARLRKVEAALERWKALSAALKNPSVPIAAAPAPEGQSALPVLPGDPSSIGPCPKP